jgi:hypothetical protein
VSRVAKSDENLDIIARSLFEKYLYLGTMVLVMTGCVTFFMLKIARVPKDAPGIQRRPAAITRLNITSADYFVRYSVVIFPVMVILTVIVIVAGLHYIGFLPRDVPGVSWITRRFDAALVMRSLALAISMKWPLNKTVWMLARIYPKRSMRGRLVAAGRFIDNGENWCDRLGRAGIIGQTDWAVLKAANVGNAEWALDEMADSSVRRLIYRWRRAEHSFSGSCCCSGHSWPFL